MGYPTFADPTFADIEAKISISHQPEAFAHLFLCI
jgi:hypothetical protein